jgi:tetratricopeptide (TPR) repeat protein
MGLIHYELGNYEQARQAYEQAYRLSQEMGNMLSAAVWLNNMGDVALCLEQYEPAEQYTRQAIDQFRQLNSERYLTEALIQQAEILFCLKQAEQARLILAEAMRLGEPIQEKEVLFKGYLLQARLYFAGGEQVKALALLQTLLSKSDSPDKVAHIHYQLWQMTGDTANAQTAIDLYRELLDHTPNHQYRQHLETLLAA